MLWQQHFHTYTMCMIRIIMERYKNNSSGLRCRIIIHLFTLKGSRKPLILILYSAQNVSVEPYRCSYHVKLLLTRATLKVIITTAKNNSKGELPSIPRCRYTCQEDSSPVRHRHFVCRFSCEYLVTN